MSLATRYPGIPANPWFRARLAREINEARDALRERHIGIAEMCRRDRHLRTLRNDARDLGIDAQVNELARAMRATNAPEPAGVYPEDNPAGSGFHEVA